MDDRHTGDHAGPSNRSSTAGVLLAAGLGSRFDAGNKLLAAVAAKNTDGKDGEDDVPDDDGDAVVRHALDTLCAAGLSPIVVVVGHEAARVRAALNGYGSDVRFVENPAYEAGQATSVATGVQALSDFDGIDRAVFALGDMPFVSVATVDRLVTTARETGADIVAPTYEGRRGNPVVFGQRHFDALSAVDGDTGGRVLFDRFPVTSVAVGDPGVLRDIDTVADLEPRLGG